MPLQLLTHISGEGNLRLDVCNLQPLAPRHEDWEGAASVLSKALDKAEAESGVSPTLSRVTDLIVRGAGSAPQVCIRNALVPSGSPEDQWKGMR